MQNAASHQGLYCLITGLSPKSKMNLVVRSSGLPTRSDTNRAVQPHKMARGQKVEGLYFGCSENKGADQFRGYREGDLRLCFRICKKPVFS